MRGDPPHITQRIGGQLGGAVLVHPPFEDSHI
jgi:hypothetical protein